MYKKEEEIFQDILFYVLSEENKRQFRHLEADQLIRLHHSFGQWIRNTYLLWSEDNPHVVLTDSMHDNFPDQISQRIIERLWSQLTGKEIGDRLEAKQVEPDTYIIDDVTVEIVSEQDLWRRK